MENRLLNKYGVHRTTDIGQEIDMVVAKLERELQGIIEAHNLSVSEQHTLQHIVISAVQCMVAEHTLRNGLQIRKDEREHLRNIALE